MKPKIIFEDPNIIVIDKPAGLLSQGDKSNENNLVDWLRKYLNRHYVGLVHRLDRNTSGIMVVAKRTKAARRLTEALQKDKIARSYLGLVEGVLKKTVIWKHFLIKDSKTNKTKAVTGRRPGGDVKFTAACQQNNISPQRISKAKEAILKAKPLETTIWKNKKVTLVEFKLETGRSHQIRVQSSREGFPLLGDTKYGNDSSKRLFPRPALHSYEISLPHPISGETLSFKAELPRNMREIMEKPD